MNVQTVTFRNGHDWIKVEWKDGAGSVESNLKQPVNDGDASGDIETIHFNMSVDAVESLILAHACAGVDILAKPYHDGVWSCLESIANILT